VDTLSKLFAFYKERIPQDVLKDPALTKRIKISVKEEKVKRVSKTLFQTPRGFEQIESYVKSITSNGTLDPDYKA
jgi:hypothetical protein